RASELWRARRQPGARAAGRDGRRRGPWLVGRAAGLRPRARAGLGAVVGPRAHAQPGRGHGRGRRRRRRGRDPATGRRDGPVALGARRGARCRDHGDRRRRRRQRHQGRRRRRGPPDRRLPAWLSDPTWVISAAVGEVPVEGADVVDVLGAATTSLPQELPTAGLAPVVVVLVLGRRNLPAVVRAAARSELALESAEIGLRAVVLELPSDLGLLGLLT